MPTEESRHDRLRSTPATTQKPIPHGIRRPRRGIEIRRFCYARSTRVASPHPQLATGATVLDTGDVRITLNELTVNFDHLHRERLLDDWRWLIGPSKQPILLSAIGDAFVQDEHDGTVHLLDTAAGTCQLVAEDEAEFRNLLTDAQWATDHLAVEAVVDFLDNDLRLASGQIYSWKQPPALGGKYELANAAIADIEVHFSITGQLHEQLRSLPPATPVSEVRFKSGSG